MFHIYSRTLCHLSLSNSTLLPNLSPFSDLSSLVSLQNMYSLTQPNRSTNPNITPIFISVRCLCFSYMDSWNENVDVAAKNPPPSCTTISFILCSDLKNYFHSKILNLWQNQWSLTSSKLLPIKPDALYPLPSTSLTRYQETLLSRLRIGHTRLTQSFLLLNLDPSTCPLCQSDDPLTVAHLLVSCQSTKPLRDQLGFSSSLPELLAVPWNYNHLVIHFLSLINVIHSL